MLISTKKPRRASEDGCNFWAGFELELRNRRVEAVVEISGQKGKVKVRVRSGMGVPEVS